MTMSTTRRPSAPRSAALTPPAESPARPASGRRIKASGTTPPAPPARPLPPAELAAPGFPVVTALRILDGARTTIAGMADALPESATFAPAPRVRMTEPLVCALDVLSELEQAVYALECDDVVVESRGSAQASALNHKLAAVRSALWGLSGHLCEVASKVTGEPPSSSPVRHALALATGVETDG